METYPNPANKKCIQKILSQMNNPIYKIKEKNEKNKFCFFCNIKYENKNIPVIILNYYLIEEKNNNSIQIIFNNKLEKIKFGKARYKNKDLNISIIEIKEDNINELNFFEINDNLYGDDSHQWLYKESIYILHYNNKNDFSVSYGVIKDMNNSQFIHTGKVYENSHGFPIFNLSNNKLIGIHNNKSVYYNNGILFNCIINEFLQYFNIMNEIIITILVKEDDVSFKKNIYFLDNYIDKDNEIDDENKNEITSNNLKELNEYNTEIYRNNEIKEYKKYFQPEKAGEYNIKLKFKINLTE